MSKLECRFELRRLEVINGAGGWRVWSADAKAAVLDEKLLPGAVVSVVAHLHGLISHRGLAGVGRRAARWRLCEHPQRWVRPRWSLRSQR